MKKITAIILLLSILPMLFSCGKNDGAPDGMQLVRGGEDYGYYFYAPEEWTVSNYADISSAYASGVDTTSVSYTELTMPEVTVLDYFNESLGEYPTKPTVLADYYGKEVAFGNSESAIQFVFDHEYSGHKFRTMQIFVKFEDRFGIFTFNSMLENISSSEMTQYDYYDAKRKSIIENFKFVTKTGAPAAPQIGEADADGYHLVSNKNTAKFALYLPTDFTVEHASGMVTASTEDGSTITMSAAVATGVVVSQYWETRKTELSAIVGEITEIRANEEATLGNSKRAFVYEYTYTTNGKTFHVYQVLAVTSFNGFVFTYTATEENYQKHFDTIIKITEKVEL